MTQISDNALDLLKKRYFKKDYNEKKWEDICVRVSYAIADAEETVDLQKQYQKEFYDLMVNMDFIPSTPVLLNADINNPGQLSSCFIIDVQDNLESIYKAKAECAKIFQKNGGVGFNISALRPLNSTVETSKGYSCGPLGFMEEFNLTADIVTRNNVRKGAMKIDLNDWHPDIYKFVHCKDDISKFTFMNISVSLSNKFMLAVIEDKEWQLKFPDYSGYNKKTYNDEWDGNIDKWEANGYPVTIYKTVKAKDLYKEIMESAWKSGEPGVSFRDNMDEANTNPHLGHITGTNPCLHKDSYLVTENGLEKISQLKSKIWNGNNYNESKAWETGIKKVNRIMTNSGYEYVTTPDHRFLLDNGEWCEAQDLIGKQIKFDCQEKQWNGYNPYPNLDYQTLGFELGDGGYHKASHRMKYIYVTPGKDDEVAEIIEKSFNNKFAISSDNKKTIIIPYGTPYANIFNGIIKKRMIPDWVMQLPKNEMRDFLRGLFSANGCNLKKYNKIQLPSVNKEMLQQIQQMLLLFGIKAKLWYHNKQKDIKFANGTYTCNESCHLILSRSSYRKYLDAIGFIQTYKNGYEVTNGFKEEDDYETVILISELDETEVWDFTESQYHQGISNGAYVHNCSEFCNIPYSSCNLGSINLVNCGNSQEEVFSKLKVIIPKAIRFLDNMITVNELPLDKINKVTKDIRPIGLGTFGLADLLYKLQIPYNSPEGYDFIDKLYEFLKYESISASADLAREKSIYPKFHGSTWDEDFNQIMRNSNLISIAPTGSISFLANASGGLEPNYALVMQRRTNEGDIYYIVNPIFEQELKNKGLYSLELIEKINNNNGSIKGIYEIPQTMQKIFVAAYDIAPEEHLKVLSIIQSHVDLSCSKTINLTKNVRVDYIMNLYLDAWKEGIKGITVYRDGCRDNQVLSTGFINMSENEQIEVKQEELHFPKALPEVNGVYRKLKTGCGSIRLFLGVDSSGNLIEIRSETSGGSCQANIESLSRLTSKCLGMGVSHDDICDQLGSAYCKNSFDKTSCRSCAHVISKAIKNFDNQNINIVSVTKGEKITEQVDMSPVVKKEEILTTHVVNKMVCPECNEPTVFGENCVKCQNCGWSKC